MYKVVKGAKYQRRPSASYFYNELNVPVGFTVQYRPRKGGKMITHTLQLRNNGTPYWRAEEKLPVKRSHSRRPKRKGSKRKGSKRKGSKRRGSKKRGSKRRGSKRRGSKKRGSKKKSLRGGM